MIKLSIAIATLFAITVIEPRCIEVADDYVESSGWEPPRFINWGCPNMTGTDCGEKVPDVVQKTDCPCPDGWLHYKDSCYRLEHDLLNMANAHKNCKECDATLFVPNSQAELDYMNRRMTKGMFHWIGLAKFNEQQQPQWQANDTKGYNYYYSCDLMFYSVCERNATLNNLMNQNSAVLY
ncbi:hypothetical protein WR25_18001 [Diploscapter pachys]|uniref:C-type lectin domain-containing protein n=1 Tax=Diploscapter pachys TaxID=2018661 RepID=A0A2A2JG25_9BILA|nr:hypothetical protein WR25_18001 [Diploscapter pachys]